MALGFLSLQEAFLYEESNKVFRMIILSNFNQVIANQTKVEVISTLLELCLTIERKCTENDMVTLMTVLFFPNCTNFKSLIYPWNLSFERWLQIRSSCHTALIRGHSPSLKGFCFESMQVLLTHRQSGLSQLDIKWNTRHKHFELHDTKHSSNYGELSRKFHKAWSIKNK